jgi:DNA-binding CsgD family transcriptional regulator
LNLLAGLPLRTGAQLAALAELDLEFENIRAAWLHAAECRDFDLLDSALDNLYWYGMLRSRMHEIDTLLDAADVPGSPLYIRLQTRRRVLYFDPSPDVRSTLEYVATSGHAESPYAAMLLGLLLGTHGEYAESFEYLQTARKHYESISGGAFHLANVYHAHGNLYINMGSDLKAARDYLDKAISIRRSNGERCGLAWSLSQLSALNFGIGNLPEGNEAAQESYDLFKTLNNRDGMCNALAELSYAAYLSGAFDQCRELARQGQQNTSRSRSLGVAGVAAMVSGEYQRAIELLRAGLETPDMVSQNMNRIALSVCLYGANRVEEAQRELLVGARAGFMRRLPGQAILYLGGGAVVMQNHYPLERTLELLTSAFEYMGLAEVPEMAMAWLHQFPIYKDVIQRLDTELSPDARAAAWERGRRTDRKVYVAALVEDLARVVGEANPTPSALLEEVLPDPLTEREGEILTLILQGLSNDEIASRLVVGISTVKKHINHLYAKLGVINRAQAIARAHELGLG